MLLYFGAALRLNAPRIRDSLTIDASTGPRSCQVCGLLFHLDLLGKQGSPAASGSACQARAGRHRQWRSSGESSRRRRHVCHRGRRAGRMCRCTTAHLSRRRRIPRGPCCTGLACVQGYGRHCTGEQRRAAVAVQRQLRRIGLRRLRPYGERAGGAPNRRGPGRPARRCTNGVAVCRRGRNESIGFTAVVMRVKALAARHREGRRGGTAPMRAARSPAADLYLFMIRGLSSFILLSLAAGPVTLPLLWGIDRAYCGTTHCSNPDVFKIYLRPFDLIIQDDA